jgi:hypothetical protein
MGDLKNPGVIYFKAFLFLVCGTVAAATLFTQSPTLMTAFLLIVTIWAFCRLYYFMFYVIEHYVDPGYKFSGIIPFILYVLRGSSTGNR